MKSGETVSTVTKKQYVFDRDELLVALRQSGKIPVEVLGEELSLFVRIPGGGDWSNTDLEISKVDPVRVRIVTKTVSATDRIL